MVRNPILVRVLLVTWVTILGSPLTAAPDIDVVLATGEIRLFSGSGRKLPEGQKVSQLRRGDLVWTGKDGRMAYWIGGHTLVEAVPGTFFGVMPQTVEGKSPRRKVDVVCVFLGSVKAGSNWKKVPSDTQIRVMGPKGMRGTNAGPVVITVPLPQMEKTGGKDPVLAINLPKALAGVSKPLPFSEALWGVAAPASKGSTASTASKTAKPAAKTAATAASPPAASTSGSRGGSIDDIVAEARRKAEQVKERRKKKDRGR